MTRSLCKMIKTMSLFLVVLIVSIYGAQAQGKVYSFGVVPQFEARKLAAIWVPILNELEKRTGYKISMEGSPRILEFEASFQRGDFDFAYMNPYHALIAMEGQGYAPLVRDGSRQLYGVLVVREDSPITDVKQLQGQSIAFPSPNALGASLLMRAELTRDFELDFKSIYSQTHTSSYLNAVLGKTAAAGGVMSSLKKQKEAIQKSLRVLHETKKMAPHPIVAHPRVPAEVSVKVKQALLEMGQDETSKKMLSQVPMHRPIEADPEDYQKFKDWGLQEFYVETAQ